MRLATINGVTRSINAWAKVYGISRLTIYYRLANGMSVIDAVTKPARKNERPLTHNGVTKLRSEWAKDMGVSKATITARLKRGLSVAEALTMRTRGRK